MGAGGANSSQRSRTSQLGLVLLLLLILSRPLCAAEPVLEFLAGLRDHGYHDVALDYLDEISRGSNLPADVRTVLGYERGQTLLGAANDPLIGPDAQRQRLDAARAQLEEFARSQPSHPLAARAHSDVARILLNRARVDLWDSAKPENAGQRETLRTSLRKLLTEARTALLQSVSQSAAKLVTFPSPIPEDDKRLLAERNAVENQHLTAGIDSVQCLYLEAQTYDDGTSQKRDLLTRAAAEFEKFQQEHRSTLAGLYASVWRGKCFEERGDTRTALGLYQEAMANIRTDDGNASSLRLRDLAFRYTLICLNHPSQKKPEEVILRGEEWLKTARQRTRTEEGMGIQWELARAHEALGEDRAGPEAARQAHLTQALGLARNINRFPGEFKASSNQMIQRMMLALGRKLDDPTDFDAAYVAAGQLYDEITRLRTAMQASQAAGKLDEARQQSAAQAAAAIEMTRLDELALRLATPASESSQVNSVWLRLSYGYVLQQRNLEAAALADFLMVRFASSAPELSLEAGYIGVTALQESARDLPPGEMDFEIRMASRIADQLAARWPDSDRTHDARGAVARLMLQNGDELGAAESWLLVPVNSPRYPQSQVRAGLALWRRYVALAGQPAQSRSPESELLTLKGRAVAALEAGLAAAEKLFPQQTPWSSDLVQGKLALAGIRNLDGVYQTQGNGPAGALELLTAGSHSVIAAVTVPAGQARPASPDDPRSRQSASYAYRQLLRTYVGLKMLDEARATRAKLEEVAGSEDEAALTEIFVQFGRQLQEEIQRLRDSGQNQRLQDVRSGFESFLNDLFQRTEGQSFASLLWIAETYSSLAASAADQSDRAAAYYNKASAAYQSILDQSAARAEFATPQQVVACKLRLVNCLRLQKSFPKAEQVMREVLRTYPNAPNVQFEAAQLYEGWGASGLPDADGKFEIALYGQKVPVHVWGWAYAGQSLRRSLQVRPDPQLEQLHYDARFHQAQAERLYAKTLKDPVATRDHLQRAATAITGFQRTARRLPDVEYQRFNTLYQTVQRELGNAGAVLPRDLASTGGGEAAPPPSQPGAAPQPPANADLPANQPASAAPTAPSNLLAILLVAVLGVAMVGGLVFFSLRQSRKKRQKLRGRSGSRDQGVRPENPFVFPGLPDEKKPAAEKKRPAERKPPAIPSPGTRPPAPPRRPKES